MIEVAHWKRWATSILEGFVTVYLGTLGRMIPIYSTPSAQLETEERYTFTRTLEGRRKAQPKPIGRRTWGLNAQFADPAEHSLLSQFASGAWGNGPFVFVSADAPVSNMLTPAVSTCGPEADIASVVSVAGPWYIGNGVYSSRSLLNTDPSVVIYFGSTRAPVVTGRKVTASAWVNGAGAAVRLFWYDANGALISSATSSVLATAVTVVRSWVTATPPANAVACLVGAVNCSRAAQPAITWSDELLDWSEGQGCSKAVVSSVSRDQVLAVAGNTYSNVSFTVMEVG